MQTNIQQFVKDNQGSLITFLHNAQRVSKVVVDIQGEYFTCKSNASDPKIDGFYYFSDCRMLYDHPLVEILEKHNVSVLNLSIGRSCIFKYNHYDDYDSMVNGTCLTTSQPVGFHIDSIKEAWAIVMVEGKYTKVYPQTLSTTPAPVSSKSVDKLDSYLKEHPLISVLEKHKVVTLHFTIGISSMFKYDEYNRGMIDGTCLITSHPVGFNIESIKEAWSIVDGKYTKIWEKQLSQAPVSSPPMDKLASYFEAQNNVKNACEKVNNTLEKLNNSFDKVFKSIDKEEPIKQKITSGRAYTRYPSSEIKTDTFYKDGKFHGDYLEYHENGNIKTKAFYQDGKLNGDYYEYFNDGSCSKFIEYKNGLKNGVYIEYGRNDKGFQVSFHKYFKDDVEVTVQKNII